MKKKTRARKTDGLRPEYDFAKLELRGVGKFLARSKGSPSVVLLNPDDEKAPSNAAKKGKSRKTTTRRAR